MTERVWVLADPRAGTAAQALGIAERLGLPFRTVPLAWGPLARLPLRWRHAGGAGAGGARGLRARPGRDLAISAGRRSAPVALWLAARGVRTVHCMRPGFGAARFDLLVRRPPRRPARGAQHPAHPRRRAPHVARAPGRRARRNGRALRRRCPPRASRCCSAARCARRAWRPPPPPPSPAPGRGLRRQRAGHRVAAAPGARPRTPWRPRWRRVPHRLHRWGDAGANPYAGMLAWADAVVVTGDSVSMLSEALATSVPVFIADPGGLGPRHRAPARQPGRRRPGTAAGRGARALPARRRWTRPGASPPRSRVAD